MGQESLMGWDRRRRFNGTGEDDITLNGKTGECLYIELFTWKMSHLYLFLCKKKAKALRFGICHSLPTLKQDNFLATNVQFLFVSRRLLSK
jgi:hypothetical protein